MANPRELPRSIGVDGRATGPAHFSGHEPMRGHAVRRPGPDLGK
ncbi:hypothetical protein [Streptomyces lydicus]|nr:hypothetical protein [Streptomyces lydicus]